ncbi:MAG: topoisomerase C-terminal repeat-containing protein, partial [Flavobacteriales bacterium]
YELVQEVKTNNTVKRITSNVPEKKVVTNTKPTKTSAKGKKTVVGKTCMKCKTGTLIKGGSAYGCSNYKNGCKFVIPFKIYGKKVSENQLERLIEKGSTTNLKGFTSETGKVDGLITFDENYNLILEPKVAKPTAKSDKISCPKCKKGTVIKGKTAYGCSEYKRGCEFVFPFQKIKEVANGKALTKELVLEIISR